MEYKKFNIITLEDNTKMIILEKVEYEGNTYLYVDKVTDDENDTLGEFEIMRVYNEYIEKETDTNILMNILPLFSSKIKLNNE